MKVLVGSKNPVKIEAVKEAFSKYFPDLEVFGISADSRVSAQPVNGETFEGAKNRAMELKQINTKENLGANYFVGIEGGIAEFFNKWFALGLMCIIDTDGKIGFGTSPLFELPYSVTKELLNGIELGEVMDRLTGDHNTKQKSGAIGYFTNGVMDRKSLYVPGLITAMIPFLHKDFFFGKSSE
jgi:inosine/xanthosine triphosphatase